jgi:hypothetical protein
VTAAAGTTARKGAAIGAPVELAPSPRALSFGIASNKACSKARYRGNPQIPRGLRVTYWAVDFPGQAWKGRAACSAFFRRPLSMIGRRPSVGHARMSITRIASISSSPSSDANNVNSLRLNLSNCRSTFWRSVTGMVIFHNKSCCK